MNLPEIIDLAAGHAGAVALTEHRGPKRTTWMVQAWFGDGELVADLADRRTGNLDIARRRFAYLAEAACG